MSKKLSSLFVTNPDEVPISAFPINNMEIIRNYNDVCYNAAVDFVDGYGQDSVRESKAGAYCRETTKQLIRDIGKDPCQYRLTAVPVIELRPKLFGESLGLCGGNAEAALKMCHLKSREVGANPEWCDASYMLYKKVYDSKMPKLPQPYREYYEKPEEADSVTADKGKKSPSPNLFPIILIIILVAAFIGVLAYLWFSESPEDMKERKLEGVWKKQHVLPGKYYKI